MNYEHALRMLLRNGKEHTLIKKKITTRLKVVRYVTFSNCQNWRSINILYILITQYVNRLDQELKSDSAPQKDHPKNDVFDRFSGIKVSKNFRFFLKNTHVVGKSILYLMVAISFMTLL